MLDKTDSYCERCGTRYVFRTNAPRTLSLKGARVLAKGLKNFVLTDGQSMTDAMALARGDDEREDTTRMTEAFHRTFNFCMTCRQYACEKCWNERQGACLTCAPEPGFEPVAPEDHLIVRTPAARGDNDWALFSDILGSDAAPAVDASPPLSAWPTQDLQVPPPGAHSGGGIKRNDQPVRRPADPEAWSLWPIADEIAPEMTLTHEELELVEARLAQDEPAEDTATAYKAIQPQALPDVSEGEAWALRTNLAARPAAPNAPSRPVADVRPDQATDAEEAAPDELGIPLVNADVAPPPSPTPAHGQTPAFARLLGRLAPRGDGNSPARRPQRGSDRGQPSDAQWPHATAWSERPVRVNDWLVEGNPAALEPENAPIDAAYSATPVVPLPLEPEAAVEARAADLRGELASAPGPLAEEARSPDFVNVLRPVATPPAAPIPFREPAPVAANQQTLFDVSPATDDVTREHGPDSLAWPDADSEVAEALRTAAPSDATPGPPRPADAVPSSREPQAPAPWPPLGASWPARETPGAPWPGPKAPSVPAALVVKEAAIPVVAEMWAESAQEVLNRGSVRVCHHCALPVSTQARYCRRCGTKQA